jgi:hypothetical protein
MSPLPDNIYFVWAAGTSLQALLLDNKAMAKVHATFMGAPNDAAELGQPSDEDCTNFLRLLQESCEIGQHAVAVKTQAKKAKAMADVEQWLAVHGKRTTQGTPVDFQVYLCHWAETRGTFHLAGKLYAAPSSLRAQSSFIATELDKNPATSGPWDPHANNGNGGGGPPHDHDSQLVRNFFSDGPQLFRQPCRSVFFFGTYRESYALDRECQILERVQYFFSMCMIAYGILQVNSPFLL